MITIFNLTEEKAPLRMGLLEYRQGHRVGDVGCEHAAWVHHVRAEGPVCCGR